MLGKCHPMQITDSFFYFSHSMNLHLNMTYSCSSCRVRDQISFITYKHIYAFVGPLKYVFPYWNCVILLTAFITISLSRRQGQLIFLSYIFFSICAYFRVLFMLKLFTTIFGFLILIQLYFIVYSYFMSVLLVSLFIYKDYNNMPRICLEQSSVCLV